MKQWVVVLVWSCGCTKIYREVAKSLALCRVTSLMVRCPDAKVELTINDPGGDFKVLVGKPCMKGYSHG